MGARRCQPRQIMADAAAEVQHELAGSVPLRDGDLDTVAARAQEARAFAGETADRRLERMPIHMLAVAARMAGRPDEARALYEESIALNDELGETRMAALEHRNLAYVELHAG